jgi:predicted secreted Zn-dependent protease
MVLPHYSYHTINNDGKFEYATATSTNYPYCKHKNKRYHTVNFWIFKKEIQFCMDCKRFIEVKKGVR